MRKRGCGSGDRVGRPTCLGPPPCPLLHALYPLFPRFPLSLTEIDGLPTARAQRGLPSEHLHVGRAFKGKRPWLGRRWGPGPKQGHQHLPMRGTVVFQKPCLPHGKSAFFGPRAKFLLTPPPAPSSLQEGPPVTLSSQGLRCPPVQTCQQLNPQET